MPEVTDEQIARARDEAWEASETIQKLRNGEYRTTMYDTCFNEGFDAGFTRAQSETSSAARGAVRDFVAKVEGEDYWLDFEKEKFREVYAEMFNEEL